MKLPPGKLPAALLSDLLASLQISDERVILGPGIGRDAAVIDLGDRVLVAKTDPITFATEHLGWYAVNVNANDIACMGAEPLWFLATALLPPGTDDGVAREIFQGLKEASEALGITLVGGHTEVTAAVTRPIIIGAMLGEASRDDVVMPREDQPAGDAVLLTQRIAIEGTALLARESADVLRKRGVASDLIDAAAGMLFDPGISIVVAAKAIRSVCRPVALHDPTEGGLATALHELASAMNLTFRIEPDAVRLFDATASVCNALSLDPWGLLASGALLAVVAEADAVTAIEAAQRAGIACGRIGTTENGPARVIMGAGETQLLRTFPRDELARFYDEQGS